MSDEIKDTTTAATEVVDTPAAPTASEDVKGKGKAAEAAPAAEEDDEDEDDDEDEEMEEDDDDDDEEEDFSEIDPSQIITSSRRSTRTVVDYASEEAAKKAGLSEGIQEDDEEEAEGEQSFMKTDEEDE